MDSEELTNHKLLKFFHFSISFLLPVVGLNLPKNWQKSLRSFSQAWQTLHQEHGVSITNKVHIIMDHVQEYILSTGKGLGRVSDQIVEACHSALNKRLMRSNYWVKDVESSQHGKKFYKGILHFNSYNIGS